ncbi:MAG TPA: HEAT repeat domain-containing protein [Longimicrobiales bacterium]|nr:HEAT repeat domain-containing protein [Longimicrobiales bacterium]
MMKRHAISTMLVAITSLAVALPAAAQKQKVKVSKSAVGALDGYAGVVAFADGLAALDDLNQLPPAAWQEQDPANALYKAGRDELNRSNYTKAAANFAQIVTRYPKSAYAPDAYYWQAFALYRIGNEGELKTARALLQKQRTTHPRAATVTSNESATLLARINGQLAELGDAESGARVRVQAGNATQGCPDDGEDDVRTAALNAFLNMNSEQALPMLKQILARRDACSAKLREKAVFLVSQKRGGDVEDILLSAARNDPNSKVREQAVFWLSQVPSERALGYLEDILKNTNDEKVADKAIFAISQHNSPRASQMLRDYAMNANAEFKLRDKAIFWLGQRRGTENTQFLKDLYAKERDAKLKDKVIFALSQQRGNESWLMGIAMNESESVEMRKKALFWAGQNRGTPLTELTGLYDRMSNREMKEQLIFVYSQRREPEAVNKLMDIAKKENDRELRKKAVFWLGQSKDPRAAEFLMQLINQ